MSLARTVESDLLIEKQAAAIRDMDERRQAEQDNRVKLRDSIVQLREVTPSQTLGPAASTAPTFKIGENPGFPYIPDGPSAPEVGNMSPKAFENFKRAVQDAAQKPDTASRDAATQKAAHIVADDYAKKHGLEGAKTELLQAARAQAAFAAREIGKVAGVDPATSSIVGYSLERALEKEGFKVMANHAIDRVGNYVASTASAASAVAHRGEMESALNKSLNWMAQHGVTRDALKHAITEHSGKLSAMANLVAHPEALTRIAQLAAKSEGALDLLYKAANDKELRQAVGTLSLAAGEQVGHIHKGAGSVAILAGAALKGESTEDMGRHAFRAAMSVLGGAAGAAAGGAASAGFGTIAGGIVGAELGSRLADKILDQYDRFMGREPGQEQAKHVSGQDLADSRAVIVDRAAKSAESQVGEKVRGLEREYSMGHRQG